MPFQCLYASSIYKSLVYVVTDRRIYKSIAPESDLPCISATVRACECVPRSSVGASGDVEIRQIEAVWVPSLGRLACLHSCQPAQVWVQLPYGNPLAGWVSQHDASHGTTTTESITANGFDTTRHRAGNKMVMYVDNPQEALQVLKQAQAEELKHRSDRGAPLEQVIERDAWKSIARA